MPPTARTPLARPQRPQRCCPQKFTRCVLITAVFTAISLLLAWEVKSGGAWARPSTWRDYTSSHHNARLRSLETWRANATAEIAALKRRDAELSDRIKALEGGGGGGASSSKSLEERLAKDEAQEQADVKTLRKVVALRKKPAEERTEEGHALISFKRLLCGKTQAQKVVLRNDGIMPASVRFEAEKSADTAKPMDAWGSPRCSVIHAARLLHCRLLGTRAAQPLAHAREALR